MASQPTSANITGMHRLVIGISGASGAIYGIRLLEILQHHAAIETHLILTNAARKTIVQETNLKIADVEAMADNVHHIENIGATIASGSFITRGMVVIPCSIKSLSSIALSHSDNLLSRAADVHIKEKRPLILVVRERPLHLGHLRLMVAAAEIGATIMPPVPAFYHHPQTIDDIIDETISRVLSLVDISVPQYQEWQGIQPDTDIT